MYARTRYDVSVADSEIAFHNAGPLFERYGVKLEGRIDSHWIACYREVVAESEGLARFRFDPASRSVSFTCRAADGPVEVMAVLKRLDEMIERVNAEATALTLEPAASAPTHTWGS